MGACEGRRRRRAAAVTKTMCNLLCTLHRLTFSCKGRDHLVTVDLQNCRTESNMVYWKEYMGFGAMDQKLNPDKLPNFFKS